MLTLQYIIYYVFKITCKFNLLFGKLDTEVWARLSYLTAANTVYCGTDEFRNNKGYPRSPNIFRLLGGGSVINLQLHVPYHATECCSKKV